ncbi:MAG: outer membrane lipoprotein-sorting protein [Bacteroidetes bacterium GWF2_33_16]|nr:MAG: outer membrane lipoprotein-sorting protein [Bacteroidetes bacterium GWE2_32_14]OFY06043.1 MAG: outer membrane lipoprotein-sorting protein [Bacteroidetes bacterium GWF2_33_16]
MKNALLVLFLIGSMFVQAQNPTGKEILDRIDKNMASKSQIVTSKMIIHGQRSSRTIEAKTWSIGENKAFTEYLAPAREKGTKMLKLEDELWIFSPSTDRIIKISGHMLRQSVMGSDLSYEDMMENSNLIEKYDAVVTGTESINDRNCWVVELQAKTADVAYQIRKIWVDKDKYIPLREELYAKSGTLLKKTDFFEITKIGNRWYPKKIVFKDMLKKGDGTEFIIDEILFEQAIDEYIFTKAALK